MVAQLHLAARGLGITVYPGGYELSYNLQVGRRQGTSNSVLASQAGVWC